METQQSAGFLTVLQHHIDLWFSPMNISARDIITYVSYFGIGFLIGVLMKRYGKWIVSMILVAIFIMATLHYFELITVHKAKIKELLGFQEIHTLDEIVAKLQSKLQALWIELSLAAVATIVGFKLG